MALKMLLTDSSTIISIYISYISKILHSVASVRSNFVSIEF